MTKQISPGKLVTLLNAITVTGAGSTFALPARATILVWQISFDIAPAAVNITLRVSMDGIVWTVLDTTTATAGEVRTVASTAAPLIDVNVVTNTGSRAATVTLMAKVDD